MERNERRQLKIDRIRRRGALDGLVDHAERLQLVDGKPRVIDKLPAPIDEDGIPRVELMMPQLLGQMATSGYVWTGRFDLHHMATPKADYNVIPDNVGQAFRSLPQLKLELPREMHSFSHELFETPRRPATEAVMRQAILENEQLRTLNALIDDEQDEEATHVAVYGALMDMVEPRVNIMPSRETLAAMEFQELRLAVQSLTRTRRFGNKKLIHPAIRPAAALRHKVL